MRVNAASDDRSDDETGKNASAKPTKYEKQSPEEIPLQNWALQVDEVQRGHSDELEI